MMKRKQGNRIDIFWKQFFEKTHKSGILKYPNTAKIIKASLSLSYGNADIERWFSVSGKVLTDERVSMSERTLNAVLSVKDALKQYKQKNLLSMARAAHRGFDKYLDEQIRQRDLEVNRKIKEEKIKVKQAKSKQEL
ncbi:hypothetical protein PR048_016538 [Dryococelus australis]|uniref:HAT C-terminal dimerisation domain-containing protein n=1 Tax=Dryococelus australis TaxID=614101 RepID=A0ABQ9HKG1_9NEOP|nr:hypothetical protein PR048_016538 [Dryococelus australis]